MYGFCSFVIVKSLGDWRAARRWAACPVRSLWGTRWWAGVDKAHYTEKYPGAEKALFSAANPASLSPVIAEGRGRVQVADPALRGLCWARYQLGADPLNNANIVQKLENTESNERERHS